MELGFRDGTKGAELAFKPLLTGEAEGGEKTPGSRPLVGGMPGVLLLPACPGGVWEVGSRGVPWLESVVWGSDRGGGGRVA